jgi:hypothetical protein
VTKKVLKEGVGKKRKREDRRKRETEVRESDKERKS